MPYGFPDDKWEQAKVEARDIIIARAKVRGQIPYAELLLKITAITLEPGDNRLSPLISRTEVKEGRPILTAIVVRKTGDMQPGPGFYELAKRFGRDASDPMKCWVEEFKKVHAY